MQLDTVQKEFQLLRMSDLILALGMSKSTIYRLIDSGLFTPPVKTPGGRISAWPDYEVKRIAAAWISDNDTKGLRMLVQELMSLRMEFTLPRLHPLNEF